MRALHTAATGMKAQELTVEVISNNIANMRTTGFKRQRAEFQDMIYENLRRAGTQNSQQGNLLPVGLAVGSGVKPAATARVMSQGNVLPTERDYDIAIRGEGFFRIQLPDGRTAYTRDGSFELNADGQVVTVDGYQLDPAITVPNNARSVTISAAGVVQVTLPNQTAPQTIGTIQLARFVNKAGLESIGDNLFVETAASGQAQNAPPGSEGLGSLLQKHLEQSNVTAVSEISDLIAAQRAYEMNARIISAADQMLQSTSQMMR
ncbi:MAG: flagellar basal-body rod protein FlgG [Phreatobacter sp.]|jgi:flagellar basal-body rod protein FlgG